jgi:hypothetical protein
MKEIQDNLDIPKTTPFSTFVNDVSSALKHVKTDDVGTIELGSILRKDV